MQAQVAKMALFARFARWLPWHFYACFLTSDLQSPWLDSTGFAQVLWILFEAMATPAL